MNQININLVNETACYGIVWKRPSKLNKRKINNVRNKEKHNDKNKDKRLRFQLADDVISLKSHLSVLLD